MLDAVVVGAGPNGLTAAVELARRGLSVEVFEARDTIGGGARTEELTLPGFRHDPCSAVHPTGIGSPAFSAMPLDRLRPGVAAPRTPHGAPLPRRHGRRARPTPSARPPCPSGRATPAPTAGSSRPSSASGTRIAHDFLRTQWLRPAARPADARPLRPGRGCSRSTSLNRRFQDEKARALLAGLAAHAIAPLSGLGTCRHGPDVRARRARQGLAGAARRLPGHLRRARRSAARPRRHGPHRLRGQAPGRPAAGPRVRLRHLADRARPDRRAWATPTATYVRPQRLQDRLRAVGPGAVDGQGGPRAPAPSTSAPPAARSAPRCNAATARPGPRRTPS